MTVKKQGGWLLASASIAGVVQLSSFSLLAYYTTPQVMGVLGIVNVFLAIAYLVQDMGLSNYFIYRQSLTRNESSTLYYTNCLLGCIAAALMALVARPVGDYYGSTDISTSLYIMAINFVILGISAQYQANFIKAGRNVTLAKIDITAKIMLLVSTFILIKLDVPSVFPYLYSFLLTNTIRYFLFFLLADKNWHPALQIDLTIIRPAIVFGSYQMASQIINQLRTQLDQLIIGKVMGMEVLGLYSFAKELIIQPVKFIRILIQRLVYPKLAKVQNDECFYEVFDKSLLILSSINTFVYILFLGVVLLGIELFFEQYTTSIPLLFSLIIIGLLTPFGCLLGSSAQAKGNTKIEFQWCVFTAVISIVTLFLLIGLSNIEFFAYGVALLQIIMSYLSLLFFKKADNKIHSIHYWSLLSVHVFIYGALNTVYLLI